MHDSSGQIGGKPQRQTASCRSCGATIVWAITVKGKKIPLDAEPEKRIVLEPLASFGEVAVVHDTYVSHFATCPNADEHRQHGGT